MCEVREFKTGSLKNSLLKERTNGDEEKRGRCSGSLGHEDTFILTVSSDSTMLSWGTFFFHDYNISTRKMPPLPSLFQNPIVVVLLSYSGKSMPWNVPVFPDIWAGRVVGSSPLTPTSSWLSLLGYRLWKVKRKVCVSDSMSQGSNMQPGFCLIRCGTGSYQCEGSAVHRGIRSRGGLVIGSICLLGAAQQRLWHLIPSVPCNL